MVRGHLASIGASVTFVMLVLTGPGMCAEPNVQVKKAKEAIRFQGGRVTTYINPDTLEEEEGHYTVTFANCGLTDAKLVCLKDPLNNIDPKRLDLRFTSVTGIQPGVSLWETLDLPSLVDLDLSSTFASLKEIPKLKHFPTLKHLRLNNDRLTCLDLVRFVKDAYKANPCQRIHLYLSRVSITDPKETDPLDSSTVNYVKDLPADEWLGKVSDALDAGKWNVLEGLDISYTGLTDAGITKGLNKLTKVADLNLSGNKGVTDVGLSFLEEDDRYKIVTGLDLSGTGLSDKGLKYIIKDDKTKYEKLESLAVSNTRVTDAQLLPILMSNKHLKRLELSGTPTLASRHIQVVIGNLEKLTRLNISGTGVDDAAMKTIWQQLQVETVGPDSTDYTYSGVLKLLDVSKTSVTDRWLIDIEQATIAGAPRRMEPLGVGFPALKYIFSTDTRMTPGGMSRRAAVLQNFNIRMTATEKGILSVNSAQGE